MKIFSLLFDQSNKKDSFILIIKLIMKGSLTVIKPLKHRSKSAASKNMFQQTQKIDQIPLTKRSNHESYDFVGPLEFRKKMFTQGNHQNEHKIKQNTQQITPIVLNETSLSKNQLNSTINRNTVLSNLHRQQQLEMTKHSRNIDRYKVYQQIWEKKKAIIKQETNKNVPILMDSNIKSLYVHQNQKKIDVINNFIVHYWEMSLRNNNPILERHIKGNTFDKVQKEKMLQFRQGTKKIEQSIPTLPTQQLKQLKSKSLSICGKNKIRKQIQSSSQYTRSRYSAPNTIRAAQQQVLKISYEGNKRWMGTQNL